MSEKILKVIMIIVAIVTLLVCLGMLGTAIWALTLPHFGLFAVCLMIAAIFGVMSYFDYKKYFGKKEAK